MATSLTDDRTHSDHDSHDWRALTEKYWTPGCFPATAHDLLAVSMVKHSPGSLWWLLNQLPQAERFPSLDTVLARLDAGPDKRP